MESRCDGLEPNDSPNESHLINLKNLIDTFANYQIVELDLVEDNGFEPLTPCVQGRCSSQLS